MIDINTLTVETFVEAYAKVGIEPWRCQFTKWSEGPYQGKIVGACAVGVLALASGTDETGISPWADENLPQAWRLQFQRGFDSRAPSPIRAHDHALSAYEFGKAVAVAVGLETEEILP